MTAFENLQELIDLMGAAPGVTELSVSGAGGAQITVKRHPGFAGQSLTRNVQSHDTGQPGVELVRQGEPQPEWESQSAEPAIRIEANRVGVFHPARPAIEAGDSIAPGQIVGYIESMKLMNEIRADVGGILEEQLVEDGVPVEYGQALLLLGAEP